MSFVMINCTSNIISKVNTVNNVNALYLIRKTFTDEPVSRTNVTARPSQSTYHVEQTSCRRSLWDESARSLYCEAATPLQFSQMKRNLGSCSVADTCFSLLPVSFSNNNDDAKLENHSRMGEHVGVNRSCNILKIIFFIKGI